MGGKSSKNIAVYRDEPYPSDIQVQFLPGVEVERSKDNEVKIQSNNAGGPHNKSSQSSPPRPLSSKIKRSNNNPLNIIDLSTIPYLSTEITLVRKNVPVTVQRLLKDEKRRAKLAMETALRLKEEQQNQLKKKESIVAVSWGWGGEGRTGRGTFTYGEFTPQLVVNKEHTDFIDVAVGKRHSLLVTADGLVFSTGEGRSNQLGKLKKPNSLESVVLRRCPNAVLPSGQLKHGRDLKIVQVQAGAFTSFAREAGDDDVRQCVAGVSSSIKRIEDLLCETPENANLVELRAYLIEEGRTLGRRHTGEVVSWGQNDHGQLGLGTGVTSINKPTLIRSLSGKRVRTLAAGKEHVLASTYDGKLYVWGRGNHGRLGLGDFKDRWEPTLVKAWEGGGSLRVTSLIAAGHTHSLAVVEDQHQKQSIYTWGKGASGRLGYDRSLTRSSPIVINNLLPTSIQQEEYRVAAVALGGAHSMVLFNRQVKTSMANPWGVTSRLYAWGCNASGQLGLDDNIDRRTPTKVWLPEYEVLTSIMAGKLHSVAINVYGEMFTWGRGFFGELGHGNRDFRYKPTKLEGTNVWLKVAGGEYHSMAIAVKHRAASRRKVEKNKADYRESNAYLGLNRLKSQVLQLWSCSRRAPAALSMPPCSEGEEDMQPQDNSAVFYSCLTCTMASVCKSCALNCHKGHELDLYRGGVKTLCDCGLSLQGCRLLPVILEGKPKFQTQLAISLQALCRGHMVRSQLRKYRARYLEIRKDVCEQVWFANVIHPIMGRISRSKETRRREIENVFMEKARIESVQAARYFQLQKVLQVIDAQSHALRKLFTTRGKCWQPSLSKSRLPKSNLNAFQPMYFSTRQQFRQLLRHVPLNLHPTHKQLIRLTRETPAYGEVTKPHKMTTDPDLALLLASAQIDNHRDSSNARRIGRRRASIGGPQHLYHRLRRVNDQFKLRLEIRRRQSFDCLASIDKTCTAMDQDLKQAVQRYTEGVLQSLSTVDLTKIERNLADKLSKTLYLCTSEGSRDFSKFTRGYAAPGLGHEIKSVLKRSIRNSQSSLRSLLPEHGSATRSHSHHHRRRPRVYSIAAPERLRHHTEAWQQSLQQEEAIFDAAVSEDLPARRESWIWRVDKVKPHARSACFERKEWDRESERIAIIGESNGWDLDMQIPELSNRAKARGIAADTFPGALFETSSAAAMTLNGGGPRHVGSLVTSTIHDPTSLPWPWLKVEEDGQCYFYNQETGVSEWTLPAEVLEKAYFDAMKTSFEPMNDTGGGTTLSTNVWEFTTADSDKASSMWQYGTAASSMSSHEAYSTATTLGFGTVRSSGMGSTGGGGRRDGRGPSGMGTQGEWMHYQSEDGRWWWYSAVTGEYVAITG